MYTIICTGTIPSVTVSSDKLSKNLYVVFKNQFKGFARVSSIFEGYQVNIQHKRPVLIQTGFRTFVFFF